MGEQRLAGEKPIFSIGHSNHSLETFLRLLQTQQIEVLVDTRSHPYSRYAPQFNSPALRCAVTGAGMQYLFLGKELGGRPEGEEFYDPDGFVLYWRVAQTPWFQQGIRRLENGHKKCRIGLMCSEENPADCHRHLLIGRVLRKRGHAIHHIRGDGHIQTDADLLAEQEGPVGDRQRFLFDEPEECTWKSSRSVLPRKPQPTSSDG
jgi:uncharacterized protein (DUF488 family)